MDFENLLDDNVDDEISLFIKSLKYTIIEAKEYLLTHNLTKEQLIKAKTLNVLYLDKAIDEMSKDQDIFPLDNIEKILVTSIKQTKEEIERLFDSYINK